jgi:hypothetical protein
MQQQLQQSNKQFAVTDGSDLDSFDVSSTKQQQQ